MNKNRRIAGFIGILILSATVGAAAYDVYNTKQNKELLNSLVTEEIEMDHDMETELGEDIAINTELDSNIEAEDVIGDMAKESKITKVHETIAMELGDSYIANMPVDLETMGEMLDIDITGVEEAVMEVPMMSTHVDTFIAIQGFNESADGIEDKLIEYRKELIENTMQYPMNMAKVQASEVVRHGNDVYFILLGAFDDREEVTEEGQLEFAKNEVSKILGIIDSFY